MLTLHITHKPLNTKVGNNAYEVIITQNYSSFNFLINVNLIWNYLFLGLHALSNIINQITVLYRLGAGICTWRCFN